MEDFRGEDVTVGVIDTGIDDSHQDLSGQVVGGYDASGTGETDGTTSMGPDPNHGTMVTSLIAGHGHGDPPETEDEDDSEDEDSDDDSMMKHLRNQRKLPPLMNTAPMGF